MSAKVLIAHGNTQRLKKAVTDLKGRGFEVTATPDGGDAFARFFEEGPDLVICSEALPGLSGTNFARMVHSQSPDTPVVILIEGQTVADTEGLTVEREPLDVARLCALFPTLAPTPPTPGGAATTPVPGAAEVFTLAALKRFQRGSSPLALLDEAGVLRMARLAQQKVCSDGEIIIRQGDKGDRVFLVIEGQVRVTLRESEDAEVARIGEGGFFGEMALLSDQPRSASVWSVGTATLLSFDRDGFLPVLAAYPSMREVLSGVALERSEENLWSVLLADDEVQQTLAELEAEEVATTRAAVDGLGGALSLGFEATERPTPAGATPAPAAAAQPRAVATATPTPTPASPPPADDHRGSSAAAIAATLQATMPAVDKAAERGLSGAAASASPAGSESASGAANAAAQVEPSLEHERTSPGFVMPPEPSPAEPRRRRADVSGLDAAVIDLRTGEAPSEPARGRPGGPPPEALESAPPTIPDRPALPRPVAPPLFARGVDAARQGRLSPVVVVGAAAFIAGVLVSALVSLVTRADTPPAPAAVVAATTDAPAIPAATIAATTDTPSTPAAPPPAAEPPSPLAPAPADPTAPTPAATPPTNAAAPATVTRPAPAPKPAAKPAAPEPDKKELRKELFTVFRAKNYAAAADLGHRLRPRLEGDWEAELVIADAERLSGKGDLALASYAAFLKAFPTNAHADEAQFWSAEILLGRGRKAEAKTLYQKVLAHPRTNYRAAADDRLKKL